jgi:hypothetical protein
MWLDGTGGGEGDAGAKRKLSQRCCGGQGGGGGWVNVQNDSFKVLDNYERSNFLFCFAKQAISTKNKFSYKSFML